MERRGGGRGGGSGGRARGKRGRFHFHHFDALVARGFPECLTSGGHLSERANGHLTSCGWIGFMFLSLHDAKKDNHHMHLHIEAGSPLVAHLQLNHSSVSP